MMKTLAKIGVKLLSLYLVVQMMSSIGGIITYYTTTIQRGMGYEWSLMMAYVIVLVINFIAACLLWLGADLLAIQIVGSQEEAEVSYSVGYKELMDIALKIFGIIIVLISLNSAVQAPFKIAGIKLETFMMHERFSFLLSTLLPYLKIALGLALVFSKKLRNRIIDVPVS